MASESVTLARRGSAARGQGLLDAPGGGNGPGAADTLPDPLPIGVCAIVECVTATVIMRLPAPFAGSSLKSMISQGRMTHNAPFAGCGRLHVPRKGAFDGRAGRR